MGSPPTEGSRRTSGRRLLDGVRVLDFTAAAAGPHAAWLLGALGGDVIKIESYNRIDRSRGSTERPYAHSTFFEDNNSGKRSIAVDLKTERGQQATLDLVGHCHVVMDSFRPGVMRRLGLGSDTILARHPHMVVASLSATGSTGPHGGLPGYAGVFNALGGLGGMTGYADGPPTELRTSIDLRSGAGFAMLICWALFEARRTGVGRFIDYSATELVSVLAGEHLTAELFGRGPRPNRNGNRDESFVPQGVFRTSDDRWLALSVRDDVEWSRLAELLTGDIPPDWTTRAGRRDDLDRVEDATAAMVARRPLDEVLAQLVARRIPAEAVLDASEVSNDPLLREAGFYQEVDGMDGIGSVTVAGAPWLVDGQRAPLGPAPALGAHNAEILDGLLGRRDVPSGRESVTA